MTLQQRAAEIELMLSDVDGVLTDGSVVFDNQGIETKKFHIADGLGINLWRRAGYRFGMITGRSSHIVRIRAAELGVELVRQGVEDKLTVVQQIVGELGLRMNQVCFIGDDLPDLAVVQQAGFGMAVADACDELRRAAHFVTKRLGGRGAVREAIETILKAQGRWDDIVQRYQARSE